MNDKILLFDTTLRDGEQSPGISLNVREKLEIAHQLARLGIDVIEAGFPVTSPGDFDAVEAIAENIKGPVITALSRVVTNDIDVAWKAIKNAEKPRIHTFVMASDVQLKYQLKKTREEAFDMAVEAVKRAKSYCEDVEFSPMDATRADFDYLCKIIKAAIENGATVINVPDTVGYALPDEFGGFIARIKKAVPELNDVILSVHCHNDLGMSTANAVIAIENGARQIEGTINGIGERAGNTALEEIALIIETRKKNLGVSTNINFKEIARTSKLVSNLTGYSVQYNKAIVGRNAFAHSSGIHQDGVIKERTTYEIIDPKKIGLTQSLIILGKTSGRHAFKNKVEEMGYSLSEEESENAFIRFKELADKKETISDDDLDAIIAEQARAIEEIYRLVDWKIKSGTKLKPEAVVLLSKNGEEIEMKATGDGPVDAVCNAISKATNKKASLLSYNVSSITGGLDAQGDVTINLEIDGKKVLGRGVSTDIIEASAKAYLNAINKALS